MGDVIFEILKNGFDKLKEKNSNDVVKLVCYKYYKEVWTKDNVKYIIDDLSSIILDPSCTLDVVNSFPQLLLPILSILSQNIQPYQQQTFCILMGKVIDINPDVLKLALKYFSKHPPPWENPFENISSEGPLKKPKLEVTDIILDYEVVQTSLNFLKTSVNHFKSLWNWSDFIEIYIKHEDFQIRWLTCRCIAMVTAMDEVQHYELVSKNLTKDEQERLDFDKIIPSENNSFKLTGTAVSAEENDSLVSGELFSSLTSVGGITLPVMDISKQIRDGCLVQVMSTANNLKNAALGVACGKAVCLMGPVGCGKTSVVEHLAQVTGRVSPPYLLKVQLGDETDAKMLLGSYLCTEIPGEFVWQPGVLTQAVLGGHWLLLEDIDCASSDVVAVLACLLETGAICVPGFKDNLVANPGFQLFFTYRLQSSISGHHRKHSCASELLEKYWLQVNVEPLTREELIQVIQIKFPELKAIASKMVTLYLKFSVGEHEMSSDSQKPLKMSGRLISTRDLIKWCARACMGFDASSPDYALKVLQDAIDVFCCSSSRREECLELAKSVAACLGIIHSKAEYFCNTYKPSVKFSREFCTAGRITLPVMQQDELAVYERKQNIKFALTCPASCLIERVAVCLSLNEPVLLVGETGTGKTSTLQLLAQHSGHTLVVVNMNQQSDSADLLGGFKPVDMKYMITPVRDEFESLFRSYFAVQPNIKYLQHISTCYNGKLWKTLLTLMKHSLNAALNRLNSKEGANQVMLERWLSLKDKINKVDIQLNHKESAVAFTFVEGTLVRAIKEGHWVLLDEINLASAETLQCLSNLLEGGHGTLSLLERGDIGCITRHPEFRLMAAMNPATDVGKKDLPSGIRNRFTELFVDELTDRTDLGLLINCYLKDLPFAKINAVVGFYLAARAEAMNTLSDATGHKPHYSLRTLCRALAVAASNPCGSIQRSLHAALCLSFLTQLDTKSHAIVSNMINKAVLEKGDIKSILGQPIPEPLPQGSHICIEGYWIKKGKHLEPSVPDKYILTPCVRRNLQDLVRAASLSVYPVLLQGDTCVGKTSLITYLAQSTGNKCLRINNHEHTDLQEYIGAYCADSATGNLVFREGVLVQAMRQGYWIILDELNLAPSDVLEALNRVLDDNRELYIPETQETVRADPNFRLFATQNPPGLYGGRKVLSRAFRNRFIELHFNEIPGPELEMILQQRCDMPTSYCKKLIAVMTDLQLRRRGSAAFAGKQGFITLRDLFRWGERYRLAQQGKEKSYYDWDQHIADEGFLVLAGRVRKMEENEIIIQVIEKYIKRKVDQERLFTLNENTSPVTKHILEAVVDRPLLPWLDHIVWTFNLRKLAVLVGKASEFQEPVLLVGETGCGKTTVCQLLASANKQRLITVSCHQHSESSDFLGSLRPVRDRSDQMDGCPGKLFEWVDGPLIEALKNGSFFLADEISLADDSVLERLNSLLEPERKLLLSEKGAADEQEVTAAERFRFIGTMNPGGDFGKKELSPALRNRLTEIWCESISDREDLVKIVEHNVKSGLSLGNQQDGSSGIGNAILDFISWFKQSDFGKRMTISVRDILSWVKFINKTTSQTFISAGRLDLAAAYIHGACLTLLDGLGSGSYIADNNEIVKNMRQMCVEFLIRQTQSTSETQSPREQFNMRFFTQDKTMVKEPIQSQMIYGIHPFYIARGSLSQIEDNSFTVGSTTPYMNTLRLLRALQVPGRAILIEGSPGVGKTSLVTALAKAAGHQITRINLSDQTDVSDLFGADLPVEGATGGTFAWKDGPFLRALKEEHWILLDELNLASQSVLEGLNAVLDHRGELYIPELKKRFILPYGSKLFACQNPVSQGGARRSLPQSFLNRFTKVYLEPLTSDDLFFIISKLNPRIPSSLIGRMIKFNTRLNSECGQCKGAPWEMNLRDLMRWAQAMGDPPHPERFVEVIYADRMRTLQDKNKVLEIYNEVLGSDYYLNQEMPAQATDKEKVYNNRKVQSKSYPLIKDDPGIIVTPSCIYFGDIPVSRQTELDNSHSITDKNNKLLVLRHQMSTLRSLAVCVNNNWMSILVGNSGSGKTSVVRTLSQLCGKDLKVLAVNSAMDTTEILGGFEQADHKRHLDHIAEKVERLVLANVKSWFLTSKNSEAVILLRLWEQYKTLSLQGLEELNQSFSSKDDIFVKRLEALLDILQNLNFTETISSLCKQLKDLQDTTKSALLNAGGTFEWVDSVLVKCLQEGSWLLIDNVNLCSPAVLDRLNGLLEPNGELVLGERGVDSSGKLVTIKPHPEFRLFLAMNPQHGEISRAMRNRGIEIYMLSPEESDLHSLDMSAVMSELGLTLSNHQQAFQNVHKAMVNLKIGLDQLTTSHLLHAVTLTVQHCLRGQPLIPAFLSCCTNVYLKSRQLTFDQKERVAVLLKEVLKDQETMLKCCEPILQDELSSLTATINTLSLQEHSFQAMIRQQGVVLSAVLKALFLHDEQEISSLNLQDIFCKQFCDLDGIKFGQNLNINLEQCLPYLLISFYSFANKMDLFGRDVFIQHICDCYKRNEEGFSGYKLSSAIFDLLTDIFCRPVKKFTQPYVQELPWDLRRVSNWINDPKCDWSTENKTAALLYFFAQSKKDLSFKNDMVTLTENKSLSALEFSKAFNKGKFSDLSVQEPIINQLFPLLSALDDSITIMLMYENLIPFSTSSFDQLLSVLRWRNRLHEVGQLDVFSKNNSGTLPRVSDFTLSSIIIHYKWLKKWLLPEFMNLVHKDPNLAKCETISRLKKVVSIFDASLSEANSPLRSLTKVLSFGFGQPLPLADKDQAEIALKISKFQKLFSVNEDIINFSQLQKRVQMLISPNGKHCRLRLASAEKHFQTRSFHEASSLLSEIEENYSLLSEDDQIMNNLQTESISNSEINLWPLKSAILLQLNTACRSAITSEKISQKDQETIMNLLNWSRQLPFIPANIIGWLDSVSIASQQGHLSLCSLMLTTELMQQFNSLPVLKNSRLWLTWQSQELKEHGEDEIYFNSSDTKETFYSHTPLISTFVACLISPENKRTEDRVVLIPSLHSYKDRTDMLNQLKEIIWRNCPSLVTNQLNYSQNEEQSIRNLNTNCINILSKFLVSKDFLKMSDLNSSTKCFDVNIVLKAIKAFIEEEKSKQMSQTQSKRNDEIIENLLQQISDLNAILNQMKIVKDKDQQMIFIGQAWVFLGLTFLIFFTCIDIIDPVYKNALKLEYAREEHEDLQHILTVEEVQGVVLGGNHFPYKQVFTERISSLKLQEEKLKRYIAVRPDLTSYTQLSKELLLLTTNICSPATVMSLVARLENSLDEIDSTEANNSMKEAEGWLNSVRFIYRSTAQYATWFPDIVNSVLFALSQMIHGVELLCGNLRKQIFLHELKLSSDLLHQMVVPLSNFIVPEISQTMELVDVCTSKSLLILIEKAWKLKHPEKTEIRSEVFRLSKCCLQELYNVVTVKGTLQDGQEWKSICQVLDHVVLSWQNQEEVKKDKMEQEENLYINKPRTIENLTEDEEISKELSILFPTHRDKDFGDIEIISLDSTSKVIQQDNEDSNCSLNTDDIKEIHRIHSEIVTSNTTAHWINVNKNKQNVLDFISPFAVRFNVFGNLLDSFHEAFDSSLDLEASPGLCLAVELAVNSGSNINTVSRGKYTDFYHDANIAEVRQCKGMFEALSKRVKELLNEWPDHPTLNQIIMIIKRILAFEATSPISRFLTGLELLLSKLKEWEENAHAGVSLAAHSTTITHQVIAWRKLELACWKGCLNSSAQRMCKDASKWWFHLYCIVTSYLQEGEDPDTVMTDKQLISSLENFVESSNIGEFQTRMDLLYTFHCHAVNLHGLKQEKLVQILWNLYQYYRQFSRVVAQRLKECAAPVEKKLKDFVKIARWNDINYWSVKTTVEQTHRTLHKYIKEYENILKQTAKSAMTKLDQSHFSESHELQTVNVDLYITSSKLKDMLNDKEPNKPGTAGESLLVRELTLFNKARKLCRDTIVSCNIPLLIQSLDVLCSDIRETLVDLNNTEVDETLPKEKQKSQAKNLLHRKRKTLSDLFRTLANLGLSYRAGLVVYGDELNSSVIQFATLPPLDVSAALTQIENRNADKELTTAWAGCDEYFLQSVALLAQLDKAIGKPHKDIGPPIIDRCKGFSNHLMKLCQEQKLRAAHSVELLYLLRCQTTELFNALPSNTELPKHSTQLDALKDKLHMVLDDAVFCLEQFQVFLDTAPRQVSQFNEQEPISKQFTVLSESVMGPLLRGCKDDSDWQSAKTELNMSIMLARKAKTNLQLSEKSSRFINQLLKTNQNLVQHHVNFDVTTGQFKAIKDGYSKLEEIKEKVIFVSNQFQLNIEGENINPFNKSLHHLKSKIDTCLNEFKKTNLFAEELGKEWTHIMTRSQTAKLTTEIINNFEINVESLLNTILIVIQEIYKRNIETDTVADKETGNDFQFVEGHLKEKIVNNLSNEVKNLKLNEVTENLWKLMGELSSMQNANNRQACKRILRRCIPLLDQYSLLAQFVITQQIAALRTSSKLCCNLLTLCIDLALKGFRMPEELLEEGEGESSKTGGDGMGLGEGEGKKDVSDQIESQDQLEDARPAGEEEKKEEKECKEEEKGIEMSDDFGGKLQDLEKEEGEGESGEESDKEEEPDKEMGDTDKGAETLDQEIWGSDSEEEEDDDEDDKKEEKGNSGEQLGEKEFGANEGDKKTEDEENEKEGKHQDDKKKEINEMDDQDVDDDQIDPYHGKHEPLPEPEPLDLPEDLNLDNEQKDEGDVDQDEKNPFEIDEMKDQMLPPEEKPEKEENNMKSDEKLDSDSSDDEENEKCEENEGMDVDHEEENLGDEQNDGGAKSEEKTGEEPKPEEKPLEEKDDEIAEASADKPSSEPAVNSNQDAGSKDEVSQQPQDESDSKKLNPEDSSTAEGPDQQGIGSAQQEQEQDTDQGSKGLSTSTVESRQNEGREEKRQRPGESEEERALGSFNEPLKKKLKTMKMNEDVSEKPEDEGFKEDTAAELYQHIKEAKESSFDAQTLDAATEEQTQQQSFPKKEDEIGEELEDDMTMKMDEDEPEPEKEIVPQKTAEKLKDKSEEKKSDKEGKNPKEGGEGGDLETGMEVEGDVVETMTARRGDENTFHTCLEEADLPKLMSDTDITNLRSQLEQQLASWSQPPPNEEAVRAWETLTNVTSNLSRDLSEQLRLVLEPTHASRLKGDFRTGRRINMRKVIPYIASQFRKDKIWLRRTKPSKREYQIILAIDDSSSMADNHSKELAFESLAVVSKALSLLEAGELSVLSFGETPKVLHQLGVPFMEHSGARLLQQFTFEQQKTQVGALVDFACNILAQAEHRNSSDIAQLLVIISDGRGVLNEGEEQVRAAVRRARLQGILMVFVIIDNPDSKDSILDIRMPRFSSGKLLGISPYMDSFPFPFYLILRDINNLPSVLSDALRQWFELVTNMR